MLGIVHADPAGCALYAVTCQRRMTSPSPCLRRSHGGGGNGNPRRTKDALKVARKRIAASGQRGHRRVKRLLLLARNTTSIANW